MTLAPPLVPAPEPDPSASGTPSPVPAGVEDAAGMAPPSIPEAASEPVAEQPAPELPPAPEPAPELPPAQAPAPGMPPPSAIPGRQPVPSLPRPPAEASHASREAPPGKGAAGRAAFPARAARADRLERLRALVRDLGAEARDVAASIATASASLAVLDPDARSEAMARQLATMSSRLTAASSVVADRIAKLSAVLDSDDRAYDQYGDEILTIGNLWDRTVATLPHEYTLAQHVACQASLAAAKAALDELIWHVALVTIPARLNQHLYTMAVGGRLDFAATFGDELPDPAMQRRLLEYLAGHPLFIAGVVDAPAGVIYKASQSRTRRIASYLLIFVLAIPGGLALVNILSNGIPALGLPAGWLGIAPGRVSDLLPAYTFLMVGAGFHIGVEAIRQGQRGAAGSFSAIGDWLMWIHVRELAISGGVVVAWLTLAGLAISLPPSQLTWQTALFAGYGIDSVFGLFVNRFDTIATGGLGKLTPVLSGVAGVVPGH